MVAPFFHHGEEKKNTAVRDKKEHFLPCAVKVIGVRLLFFLVCVLLKIIGPVNTNGS